MTPIENPIPLSFGKKITRPLLLFVAALLLLGSTAFFVRSNRFEPTPSVSAAWLQIHAAHPRFVADFEEQEPHEIFLRTQIDLLRSPWILEKALENPDIAVLPLIRHQRNKSGWISKKLRFKRIDGSEMLTVHLSVGEPKEAAKVVNAVIAAYFEYREALRNDLSAKLHDQLNLEWKRLLEKEKRLREQLEAVVPKNKSAAVKSHKNLLLRDLLFNEAKLDTFRAELKLLRAELDKEQVIPESLLIAALQSDRVLTSLNEKKAELDEQLRSLKETLPRADDPKILGYQRQIDEIGKQINHYMDNFADLKKPEILARLAANLEKQIAERETHIRSQEILVESIRKRMPEVSPEAESPIMERLEISLLEEQLRVNADVRTSILRRISVLEMERCLPDRVQLRKKATVGKR